MKKHHNKKYLASVAVPVPYPAPRFLDSDPKHKSSCTNIYDILKFSDEHFL